MADVGLRKWALHRELVVTIEPRQRLVFFSSPIKRVMAECSIEKSRTVNTATL